jgi:hypothetical protein
MYPGAVARRRKGEPPPDPRVSTHVYLPSDLYETVAREAQENGRSINQEIIQALKQWTRARADESRYVLAS